MRDRFRNFTASTWILVCQALSGAAVYHSTGDIWLAVAVWTGLEVVSTGLRELRRGWQ